MIVPVFALIVGNRLAYSRTANTNIANDQSSLPSSPPGEDIIELPEDTPFSAANDFRSDFVTEPTLSTLEAPILSTLEFDWEDHPTIASFQEFFVTLIGKLAKLLVLSGTAENQMSLGAALPALRHSVLLDQRSHIINIEAGALSLLAGSLIKPVFPSDSHYLVLTDIIENVSLSEAVYDYSIRLISFEIPVNGLIMPLRDVRAIPD